MPYSKEEVKVILNLLEQYKNKTWIYGEGGILVYKSISASKDRPDIFGYTDGGSEEELRHLKEYVKTKELKEYDKYRVLDIELNNDETLCRLWAFSYQYLYRPRRWHRPVLPSPFFRAYSAAVVGADTRGLYWHFFWGMIPARPTPSSENTMTSFIWGFVPLNEISDVSVNIILANRCFVVGFVDNDGMPTDKDPSHYVPFSEAFKNILPNITNLSDFSD